MSDDQFYKLAELMQQGFKEQEARLDTKLDLQLAKFMGQLTRHVDQRVGELGQRMDSMESRLSSLEGGVDQVLKNQETDQQERLAANHQLDRHEEWIGRAADTIKVLYDSAA